MINGRGTGSNSIELANVIVPEHRTEPMAAVNEGRARGTIGGSPLAGRTWRPILNYSFCPIAIGCALETIRLFREYTARRRAANTGALYRDKPATLLRLGESVGEIDVARTLLRRDIRDIERCDGLPSARCDAVVARVSYDSAHIAELCGRVVARLFRGSGGHAVYERNPLQRLFRDTHTIIQHAGLDFDEARERYGRAGDPRASRGSGLPRFSHHGDSRLLLARGGAQTMRSARPPAARASPSTGARPTPPAGAASAWATTLSLGAVIASASIFGLTYGLSSPLIAQALAARGVGETLIGLNAALYAVGVLAVARWLPGFAERVGLRTGTALSLLLVALVLPGFALAALWLWFPLRFLLGAGSEGVFVMSEAWVNQLSNEHSRATTIAVYTAALSLGFALGPLVLSAVGAHAATAYWIGGACAFVALLMTLSPRIRAPAFDRASAPGGVLAMVRIAPVALAAAALNGALETAGLTFMPIYAMRLGWTAAGANALIATLMIGAIVLQLPIGWLGDRYDRTKLVVVLAGLAAVGAAIWPLLLKVVPLAYAVIFVWGGLFVGIYTLTVTALGSRFSGGRLLGMYAGMSIAWGLGALAGPAVTGALMEQVRHGLPWVAAAACGGFTAMVWERGSLVGRAQAGRAVGSGPA